MKTTSTSPAPSGGELWVPAVGSPEKRCPVSGCWGRVHCCSGQQGQWGRQTDRVLHPWRGAPRGCHTIGSWQGREGSLGKHTDPEARRRSGAGGVQSRERGPTPQTLPFHCHSQSHSRFMGSVSLPGAHALSTLLVSPLLAPRLMREWRAGEGVKDGVRGPGWGGGGWDCMESCPSAPRPGMCHHKQKRFQKHLLCT